MSDWSSDVCSSDLAGVRPDESGYRSRFHPVELQQALRERRLRAAYANLRIVHVHALDKQPKIGRAERNVAVPQLLPQHPGKDLDALRRECRARRIQAAFRHAD